MRGIAVFTATGNTAGQISKYRPLAEVYAFAHLPAVCNRLNLFWGVRPVLIRQPRGVEAMVAAAERSGVTLVVGYPKRYDPGYERFRAEAAGLADAGLAGARLLRVTTLESPFRPYVAHYPLLAAERPAPELAARLAAESAAAVTAAMASAAQSVVVHCRVVQKQLVHRIRGMRGPVS